MTIAARVITADKAGDYLASQHAGELVAGCLFALGAVVDGKRAGVAVVAERGGKAVVTRLCASTLDAADVLLERAAAEASSRGHERLIVWQDGTLVCDHGWKETAHAEGELSRGPVAEGGSGGAPATAQTLHADADSANYRESLSASKRFAIKTRWGKLVVSGPVVWREQRAHVQVRCLCSVGEPFEVACHDLATGAVVRCNACVGMPGERDDGTPMPVVLVRTQKHEAAQVIAGFETESEAAAARDRIAKNPGCEAWVMDIRPGEQHAAATKQRRKAR